MNIIEKLFTSRAHFGHEKSHWNPKMADFIYTSREKSHVINLVETQKSLLKVCTYLQKNTSQKILFVSTKPELAEIVENVARNSNSYYVNQHWLGGLLTNWITMKKTISELKNLEMLIQDEAYLQKATKKDITKTKKRLKRLQKYFAGMKEMSSPPDLIILVGQDQELNAILEARKLNIPMILAVDTNCDPDMTESSLMIPINDDSIESMKYMLTILSKVKARA